MAPAIPDNVSIIVADTETTDSTPDRGVCEVGFVFIDKLGTVLSEHESLIDPQKPISAAASGIHGLTNDDVADAPTLAEYFSDAGEGCYGGKLKGPILIVGHRIGFDTHTLKDHVDGEIFELCTLRWVRRLYPDMDDHKLSTAMFALALPRPKDAHRVMSDVYSALYLAKHIAERVGVDLLELARLSQEPFEMVTFPLGKHKGAAFKDVPKSYLRWASENMKDLDQDMLYTIDLHLKKKT